MGRKPAALVLTLVATASLVLAGGSVALGKEGVEATLKTDVPLNASPGESIRVAWRLTYVDEKGARRPFGAEGVFVRLISSSGGASSIAFGTPGAHLRGYYAADVTVPQAGIGGIEIGLRGTTDELFPLENDPLPSSAVALPPTNESSSEEASPVPYAVMLACVAALAGLGVLLHRHRQRSRRGHRAGAT